MSIVVVLIIWAVLIVAMKIRSEIQGSKHGQIISVIDESGGYCPVGHSFRGVVVNGRKVRVCETCGFQRNYLRRSLPYRMV